MYGRVDRHAASLEAKDGRSDPKVSVDRRSQCAIEQRRWRASLLGQEVGKQSSGDDLPNFFGRIFRNEMDQRGPFPPLNAFAVIAGHVAFLATLGAKARQSRASLPNETCHIHGVNTEHSAAP
jgi:hypothetical protein